MTESRINSILAADFGSVNTRALLFDLVDGGYRLVAADKGLTTIGSPIDDVQAGLAKVLQRMAEPTGRRFFDDAGSLIRPEQSERIGVDYFLTSTSSGNPTRAVLVGLYPKASLAAVRRAIAPFYIDAVAEVHLEDGLGNRARLNSIVHSRPQLILVTGGTDGGARTALMEMLALVRQAVTLMPLGNRPTVVYAGNSGLVTAVREMLSQLVEVLIAPNIHAGDGAALQAQLAAYFDESKRRQVKSFRRVAATTDSGIVPTARGIETMTAFFSRATKQDVLTIDVGSARAMLSHARKGSVHTVLRNDVGVGHSAASALELIGGEAVAKWLPFHPRKGELEQYALNKGLRTASVPLDMRERYIEYALLRAGIRYLLGEMRGQVSGAAPQFDVSNLGLILVAGATITGSTQGALDMMLLADALACEGIVQVRSDPQGALPALGMLAAIEPTAVVQLVASGVVEQVGTLIRLSGTAASGATALKIKVKPAAGDAFEREIVAGDLWHLPLPANSSVDLRMQTRRGLSVGGKRKLRLQVQGGRGGILFDARLNARDLAKTQTERALMMLRWFAAVTGQEDPVVIPESWLAPPDGG